MPFNSVITRSDAAALIPENVSNEILQGVYKTSTVLRYGRKLANMPRNQTRMPVLSAMASAYFVNGDTGLKQTTSMEWANKYIDAEEIAAIVPISEAVLADADYDIWSEVKPALMEAFGLVIDQAVFYGTNIPASWTVNLNGQAGLVAGASAAGNLISLANYADLYEAILGETAADVAGVFGKVEASGYRVTGSVSPVTMMRKLRNVRDADGNPIFKSSMQESTQYMLDGSPIDFPLNGAVSDTYKLISGQWDKLVHSMRQDMTFKILDQAVIQDQAGNIVYNLAQQDMVALRAVMRIGVALPKPVTRMDSGAGYPFSILTA
jgi:HK97 family phage major capsid protein